MHHVKVQAGKGIDGNVIKSKKGSFSVRIEVILMIENLWLYAGLPRSLKILESPGIGRNYILRPWNVLEFGSRSLKILECAKTSFITKNNKNKLFVKNIYIKLYIFLYSSAATWKGQIFVQK